MVQWEAVEAVLAAAKRCREVKAVFVKGSLAVGNADEFSDVDFYCLVDQDDLASFLPKRSDLLLAYRPLVFTSESDFVGPQTVAVFDNRLHFDLYTVTLQRFPLVGGFKTLWDPKQLLQQFQDKVQDHSLPLYAVANHFSSFSFTLLEFTTAWQRGDITWATRLASHLSGELGMVLRYLYDRRNAQLGMKRLELVIPDNIKHSLRSALANCRAESLLLGVGQLGELMQLAVRELEQRDGLQVDWQMFELMQDKLVQLLAGCGKAID